MVVFDKTRIFAFMKAWLLSVILLCLTAIGAAAQSVEANLVDAVQLYSDGKIKQARELLKTLSAAAPDNDAVWYYLALTEGASKELDASLSAMEKAVALDSTNFWYRRSLGRLYLSAGKAEEGTALYEKLVKDFPDQLSSVYELLDIYLSQKKYDKALEALADIEKQRGPSEEVVRTQYDVYTAMGKQDRGAAILEKFNEEYSSPTVLSILGDYYLAEFSDSLAQARYSEALALDSGYVPALLGMSEVHRHQRRYPQYFETLQKFFGSEDIPAASKSLYINNLTRSLDPKIIQLHLSGFDSLAITAGKMHPSDSTLISTIGTYYYATGRQDTAGEWFRKGADLFPESISQTAAYVQYLSIRERWTELRDRSIAAFDRFHELAFLDYANMANYNLEDYDAIIGNCQYLISNYPKEKEICVSAWSMMGDAHHSKGNSKAAYKAYDKALKLNPNYAPVLNNYAYYLSEEGKKLKKAYSMSKKTIEQEPDNATYLDTFAWILHLMGKDLEAKPFFKHAMLYGGKESAVILNHYATVLEALGEGDLAKVYRSQAARLTPEK